MEKKTESVVIPGTEPAVSKGKKPGEMTTEEAREARLQARLDEADRLAAPLFWYQLLMIDDSED